MHDEPIIYVGGDPDDHYLLANALSDIGCANELINLTDGPALIEYMTSTGRKPFLILCDLHLPGMSGIELRDMINDDDRLKKLAIPFIFLSEVVSSKDVEKAYLSLVQGFYKKASDYEELKDQLQAICNYWLKAIHPA